MPHTVALIGNPNVGKSVIFNSLVPGARQHVGNWPGKTVEKKEGKCVHKGTELKIVDLPGTYSLTARAVDELVSRNYIVEEKPDVVVHIIDASNIERNLYFTFLLLELEANVVVALNMFDVAKEKGYTIDVKKLSKQLGVPVVPTVATAKEGLDKLKDEIVYAAKKQVWIISPKINYGKELENQINSVAQVVTKDSALTNKYPQRWLAIKLLENDKDALDKIKGIKIQNEIQDAINHAQKTIGEDPEIVLADKRYDLVSEALGLSLVKGAKKWTITDMLDKVFIHKYLGIPVFITLFWAMFKFAFDASAPFMEIIGLLFGSFAEASAVIPNEILASFVGDGIFGGLGFILTFIPPIFFLFLGISFLEDSGYLARAAFIMDRIMFKLGLHGRSFIPMLLGFGCNIPAMMAARSIEGKTDRLITLLVNPFISCGARLPVYILIAGAFFGSMATAAVWSMYFLGIVVAIGLALLLRKTVLKGEPAPFIMELPLYKAPTIRAIVTHMWERGVLFLKKAGTYLLAGAIILWFLSTFPWGAEVEMSYTGQIGQALAPLFAPLGFDWRIVSSLVFGLLAKEIAVEALGIIYIVEGETAIAGALVANYNPVIGFTLMAFTLLYIPCVATIGTMKKESGSWKWTIFQVLLTLVVAYIVGLVITGIGALLGFA
ncbi:MAG: ferrous iron transport protein B [Candidatus Bathyarchaeota archaeon]|nr:MAG: ferrous iron transport protein B [Candidatus Bathyarchaeota archaeon]